MSQTSKSGMQRLPLLSIYNRSANQNENNQPNKIAKNTDTNVSGTDTKMQSDETNIKKDIIINTNNLHNDDDTSIGDIEYIKNLQIALKDVIDDNTKVTFK